jgi:cyclase
MKNKRIIPMLMLHNNLLYKSISFDNFNYIGDPLVAVKIFNEKEAEEICIIDADASRGASDINFSLLEDIASECFMPLSYGGGVKTIQDIMRLNQIGFEKIILNSVFYSNKSFVSEAVRIFGSSTIIGGIDYKFLENKNMCYYNGGMTKSSIDVVTAIKEMSNLGVGEILINSINFEGKMKGIDSVVLTDIQKYIKTPLIYSGGISSLDDVKNAFSLGADAVAVGSLFVYLGSFKAVLINYPDKEIINCLLK